MSKMRLQFPVSTTRCSLDRLTARYDDRTVANKPTWSAGCLIASYAYNDGIMM